MSRIIAIVYVELLSELNLSQVRKVGDVLSFFVSFQMYSPMMHHVWGAVGWSLPDLCLMLLPCQPCQLLRWSLTHLKDRSCHTADQRPADQCQNIQDQWGWEIPSKLEWIVFPEALCKMYFQILSCILHFLPSVRDISRKKGKMWEFWKKNRGGLPESHFHFLLFLTWETPQKRS